MSTWCRRSCGSRRGDPRRHRTRAGEHPDPRCRPAVPDHHRRPRERFPPRHRSHHRVPHRRGSGHPVGRGTALGAEVSAYFDSMLVKLTCRGRTFPAAVARAQRAVAEFRIRGVATNLPFLQAVLADPDFRAGRVTTSFIEERPQLLTSHTSGDRGTKILSYLADVTVNQPTGPGRRRCIRTTNFPTST